VFAHAKGFNEADVKRIAEAMAKSTQLRLIDLAGNGITDTGVVELAKAIEKMTCLTTINLWWNQITDVGASALAKAIKKPSSLMSINLNMNRIGDVGATALAKAIEQSTSIFFVWINDNPMISITNILAIDIALFRLKIRRNVLVLLGGESMQGIPVGEFLRHDGDHAICTRVARFLF